MACSEFFFKTEKSKDVVSGGNSKNKPIQGCSLQTLWLGTLVCRWCEEARTWIRALVEGLDNRQ